MEQGESCLYVKVNCRDRRGLLGDIILALKAMPLEVYLLKNSSASVQHLYQHLLMKQLFAVTCSRTRSCLLVLPDCQVVSMLGRLMSLDKVHFGQARTECVAMCAADHHRCNHNHAGWQCI